MFTFAKMKGEDRDLEYFWNQFKNAQAVVSARLILCISPPTALCISSKLFQTLLQGLAHSFVPDHTC